MKKKLKYRLLSFLILFAVINTAVGREDISAVPDEVGATHSSLPISENAVNPGEQLPDLSLCNTETQQAGNNLASKKVQGDKELLLLHADKLSNAVKANSGDHIKFADGLTHIFLFLFPYHFFW